MIDSREEWIALHVTVARELGDAVANFCHERGSTGVVLDDFGEMTRITAYFEKAGGQSVFRDVQHYLNVLRELFPDSPEPVLDTELLETENWAVMWQDNFKPMKIGKRLMVTPPWLSPEPEGREIIVIEPAEAFGTGTHETTQSCLVLLEEALEQATRPGDPVSLLDVGCGSGILAIAAAKLAATRVKAVDNDPVAVAAARKNAALNRVEDRIEFACSPIESEVESFDVVIANLDPMTLQANKDQLIRVSGTFLIISGVPVDQWNDIKTVFLSEKLVFGKEIVREEWGCGLFTKK